MTFFGVGGAGKTWLLKKLRQGVPSNIPVTFLDFDIPAGGHRFLADPAAGVYEIRNQLAQPAPRFDLAYGMLRYKQGAVDEPAFKGAGPIGLAWELIGAAVQANADVGRMIPMVNTRFPAPPGFNVKLFEQAGIRPTVRPLIQDAVGELGKVLWVLMGSIGVVLLIACANVANLLVRAEGR